MPMYSFVCVDCGEETTKILKPELRPQRIKCEQCPDGEAEYTIGAPCMFRVSIEGNGRKGYKMDMGNGKKVVRSSTREAYEHNIGNMSAKTYKENPRAANKSMYTKDYQRKMDGEKKAKEQQLQRAVAAIKKERK